mgnify:CR=1 FL=1|jgi:hypothetical protein|tara:strand:- start:15 stop:215 length:201 start_codon:yes stop_codon:yes gene_type:complete
MENDPIVETPINGHYQKFLDFEADELAERIGVSCPITAMYTSWGELLQDWHSLGISVTFDIDIPEV